MSNQKMRPQAVAMAVGLALLGAAATAQTVPLSQRNTHFSELPGLDDTVGGRAGFEGDPLTSGPATAQQQAGAAAAFATLDAAPASLQWKELGPFTPNVAGPWTYTGLPTTVSGRITGVAISAKCTASSCPLFVAAAGGGILRALDGLSTHPTWAHANAGLPTLSIGSILFDPTDPTGNTLYVGTGETNGSSDSEAGLGLFKSVDLGATWTLVAGSVAVAADRAIGAISVDPADARHILIGTGVARHGMSGTYGGRYTPPGAAPVGLYESTDGGATFSLAFSAPSDVVVPGTANGTDFFRGGVSKIEAYRRPGEGRGRATQFYFSMFDYGLFRSTAGGYEQVFASQAGGSALASSVARTEFDLVPMEDGLRIYLGDVDINGTAWLYRVDNANAPAARLTDGVNNPGWILLSDPNSGNPGYGSFSFCSTQCSYDMFVASPPGRPNTVWIGGQMQYDDIFRAVTLSNGRAVLRSTDAGVSFTDMTNDTELPAPRGMHPDQHAIVFQPGRPDVAFIGSDGGLIRNDGVFVDTSKYCGPTPDPANPDPAYRNLSDPDLTNCRIWLRAVPRTLYALNDGLATLQFQGIAFDPRNPRGSLIGGTQDNGTWIYDGSSWTETVGGDGGQAGINSLGTKVHTYTGAVGDIIFPGSDPALGWNFWQIPSNESSSFYSPVVPDPHAPGTWYVGAQHIWRTTDDMGGKVYMETHCNEFFGDFAVFCGGDFEPLGGPNGAGNVGSLTGPAYGADKPGGWVSRIEVSPSGGDESSQTLWAATRIGRLFISLNPNAAHSADVVFTRIDTAAQSSRFISGIAIDPRDRLHAIVTFVGYDAYTPATPGHVFDVRYNRRNGTASWTDITGSLGDQPVLSVAYDAAGGRVFVGTDYGVAVRSTQAGSDWTRVANGLPAVTVYDLAFDAKTRTLFAATHGRGIFELDL